MRLRWQLFLVGMVGVMYLWVTPAEQPTLPATALIAATFGAPLGYTYHDWRRRWQRWTRKIGLR
jgi:hypothetical protein